MPLKKQLALIFPIEFNDRQIIVTFRHLSVYFIINPITLLLLLQSILQSSIEYNKHNIIAHIKYNRVYVDAHNVLRELDCKFNLIQMCRIVLHFSYTENLPILLSNNALTELSTPPDIAHTTCLITPITLIKCICA